MADVAIDRAGDHGAAHPETTTGLPHTKLAMWIFLASECMLFGALITTYVLYRGRSEVGPYPADVFDIPYTSVSSFVLLASSLTMVLALAAAQQRDEGRMRLWLLTTALLGMTFVGGQVYEFTAFYEEGLKLSTNLFGTTFYVLTGFHGVHVTVGVLMLLSLFGMSYARRLPDDASFPVEMVGLYWHFVDIVWIVIFTVVYLIPTPNPGAPVALEQQQAADQAGHASAQPHGAAHPSAKEYVRIGLILAGLTALEVAATYAGVPVSILIPTLIVLSVVKFALVVLWFMHLKFDDRRYARFFVMGLSGAAVLYLIVLISFQVFA